MRIQKSWIAGMILVAALGGAAWYWQNQSAAESDVTPATVAVTRGSVEKAVLASGVIEASSLVSVGARVSGQMETLNVALGDRVEAGQLIAQIDSLDQQNAVLQAEADLAQIAAQIVAGEASIREAELALDRTVRLNEKSLASTGDKETAEAALAVAKAELDALKAQKARADVTVSSAKLELDRTRITAPMAGTIVAVVTESGQTVNASSDAPTIVKIAALDRMVVKAEISEADVVRVEPGQAVTFTLLGDPALIFDATVRAVEPAPASIKESNEIATDEAIYYNGLFDVENPDGKLRIGMTAEVTITLAKAEDVLTLVSSALGDRQDDGSYAVEVWNDTTRTREARVVRVGLNTGVLAEITEGLAEGDSVIVDGLVAGTTRSSSRPPIMGF